MTHVQTPPTRLSGFIHRIKVARRQLTRALADRSNPILRLPCAAERLPAVLAEVRSSLFQASGDESRLELGKIQNLRVAASSFDGVVIEPGQLLSFWRQVGRCTHRRGFVVGRQLQEGCLVPAVGGGTCQISNALFQAATQAGIAVVERHPHSRAVPGSAAERGADATVAWNYVDLRLKPDRLVQLEAVLTSRELVVRIRGQEAARKPLVQLPTESRTALAAAQACDSCNEVHCFRHAPGVVVPGRRAFLLDGLCEEWIRWLEGEDLSKSVLLAPLDGARWSRLAYAWPAKRFDHVIHATSTTLWQAWVNRKTPATSGARQAQALSRLRAVTDHLLRRIPTDVVELVVSHEMLPYAWKAGVLGGRRFTVLQSRMPMDDMQRALDVGAARHPAAKTLTDFRADPELVRAELAALAAADRIVTPHPAVAEMFGSRAITVPWALPPPRSWQPGPAVAFGGPTAGRKGAYEVREALRELGLPLVVLQGNVEGDGFWQGVEVETRSRKDPDWLNGCFALVQPALVEERPRALLQAIANGVPTVATPACGVKPTVEVAPLDAAAIVAALRSITSSQVRGSI